MGQELVSHSNQGEVPPECTKILEKMDHDQSKINLLVVQPDNTPGRKESSTILVHIHLKKVSLADMIEWHHQTSEIIYR